MSCPVFAVSRRATVGKRRVLCSLVEREGRGAFRFSAGVCVQKQAGDV